MDKETNCRGCGVVLSVETGDEGTDWHCTMFHGHSESDCLASKLEGALELAREIVRTYGVAGAEHPAADRWDSRELFLMATEIVNRNGGR